MTPDDIVAAARACLSTPFQHQGRLPGVALDCAGLLVAVARTIGADYVDQSGYSRSPSGNVLEAALAAQPALERVAVASSQPGDVLLLSISGDPRHLAIHAGATVIHAWEAPGMVCEHDLDVAWTRRIVRVYRFRGVA